MATRDAICSRDLRISVPRREHRDHPSPRRQTPGTVDRVPFGRFSDFEVLTDRAVTMAAAVAEPYGYLLRQVADCYPASEGPLYDQQRLGATYKSLAAVGHAVGMTKDERVQWYSIAEAVPLSQLHIGHILSRLKRQAA